MLYNGSFKLDAGVQFFKIGSRRWPKAASGGPRTANATPKEGQSEPRAAPIGARGIQKSAPRIPKGVLKEPKRAKVSPKVSPRISKGVPRVSQKTQTMPKVGPKDRTGSQTKPKVQGNQRPKRQLCYYLGRGRAHANQARVILCCCLKMHFWAKGQTHPSLDLWRGSCCLTWLQVHSGLLTPI